MSNTGKISSFYLFKRRATSNLFNHEATIACTALSTMCGHIKRDKKEKEELAVLALCTLPTKKVAPVRLRFLEELECAS